jgi:hypothetical protein
MRRMVILAVFVILPVLAVPASAARWPHVATLNAQSYQLFVREWGRLTAICSAGAYFTDGKVTRLLTAGHCIALSQLYLGRGVEFLVTQSGSDFLSARVLATGWRLRDPEAKGRSASPRDALAQLPSPGFLTRQVDQDKVDISGGDWAILEIAGKRPVAELGDSDTLVEDDALFMYGYPFGGDRFFTRGFVANRNYRAPSTEWPEGYIAADVTAAPGNSGSLAVDEQGRAVAILVAGASDRLHILTPINLVRKAVPCLAAKVCAAFVKPR